MDNAGNCDTTAVELGTIIPTFGGAAARLCCILHILNLIAKVCGPLITHSFTDSPKAFIQFFFKELKRKKAVKVVAKPRRPARGRGRAAPQAIASEAAEEVVAEAGEVLTAAEEELAEILDSDDVSEVNDATRSQDLHDGHVARTVRDKAIAYMALEGVVIDPEDNCSALGLFPKVAGLAKKVHDSGTVADVFNSLVDTAKAAGKIDSDKTALDRRCPTRWNSDLDCLNAHNVLKVAVEQLTATSSLKLSSFKLTDEQWALSDEVTDVLGLFDEMTQYFSQAETPLIADTIGALEDLISSLKRVRDDDETSNVVRVAARAAVMVAEKYFSLNDECEVYAIAIVMSPNKKLDWFRSRGWSEDEIERIKNLVVHRWEESYQRFSTPPAANPATQASTSSSRPAQGVNS
ncbi:hypothetical protein FB451DRAFT_1337405 [Mycena latifolia]|nr:hypothetical protein FB451DRAFT_1337405 [Mycena latifolia]